MAKQKQLKDMTLGELVEHAFLIREQHKNELVSVHPGPSAPAYKDIEYNEGVTAVYQRRQNKLAAELNRREQLYLSRK